MANQEQMTAEQQIRTTAINAAVIYHSAHSAERANDLDESVIETANWMAKYIETGETDV